MSTLALAATLAVALWTAGYLTLCGGSPFKTCRRCDGNGKTRTRSGRAWRDCRRCHGVGIRLRAGRQLINHLRRLHRDGTR